MEKIQDPLIFSALYTKAREKNEVEAEHEEQSLLEKFRLG